MSAASDASDAVLHERPGSVLTIAITINRPARKSAVDHKAAVQTGVRRETCPRLARPLMPTTSAVLSRSPCPTFRSSDQL
jgi:hypothetical protein